MKSISFMIIFICLNFILSNNPMMMVLLIILMTTMISFYLLFMLSSSWLSFMFFLIMLGGMMVLFIYIASILSNENFNIKIKNTMVTLFTTAILLLFFETMYIKSNFFNSLKINFNTIYNKLYWSPSSLLILFIILYLLFTLIVSVQIVSIKSVALRKMFKYL